MSWSDLGDLDAWVADADVGLGDARVWRVDGLRVVRDLLQVAVRSQHVLVLTGDGWSNDGGSIVVGNAGISDGDGGEKAHKLQKGSTKRECGGGLGRVWLDEYEIRFTVPSPKKKAFTSTHSEHFCCWRFYCMNNH
jgi:hypothetical protein